MELTGLTEYDAKKIQKMYYLCTYDDKNRLKEKAENYSKYQENCKFIMNTLNLSQE